MLKFNNETEENPFAESDELGKDTESIAMETKSSDKWLYKMT